MSKSNMPNGRAPIGAAILSCFLFISLAQAGDAQGPLALSTKGRTQALAAPREPTPRSLSPEPSADRYELGPGDLVRIRFSGREDLSGEYRVHGDGGLALRALGAFQVRGKDADEVRRDIVASVTAATGVGPRVVVEVIERRPLYVAGLVNKPGAIAYVPAMTVSRAITLAGGLLRTPIVDTSIAQFAGVSTEIARLKQAEAALKPLIARLARLQAERDHHRAGTKLKLDQARLIEQESAETQQQIVASEPDIAAAKTLIEQVTGIPLDPAAVSQDAEVKYTVIRYDDDRYLHIDADETLLLRADDVLRVSLKSARRRPAAERMGSPAGNAPPNN